MIMRFAYECNECDFKTLDRSEAILHTRTHNNRGVKN